MDLKKILRTFLIISCGLILSCSSAEDEDSQLVDFGHNDPIIIDSNFSYSKVDPVDHTKYTLVPVVGPWFQAGYSFKNNSAFQVTIQTIKYTVTGIGTNGKSLVVTSNLDPQLLDVNHDTPTDNDVGYLVTVPAGSDYDSTTDPTNSVIWYVGGLPAADSVINLHFRVEAEAVGWFGTPDQPVKNFKKKIFLKVQN
jgi:hypothetical protein